MSVLSEEGVAALVATGEATSAALLALALDRAGIPATILDAARIGLRTGRPASRRGLARGQRGMPPPSVG